MTCQSSTDFVCLGTFGSVDGCASACEASPSCAAYTYSGGTQHCWTRRDAQWNPTHGAGASSACESSRARGGSAPCGPPPPPPHTTSVTATIDTSVTLGRTNALHPAVALDFWRSDDPTFGQKWGKSSALTIDLTSPVLRAAARALAPAVLRLGGSPEDSVVFDVDGSCVPRSGGNGPYAPYYCSQVHPYTYDCLTKARWEELLEFAADTGLKIALGLNGCWGRPSANASMDYANAVALFNATAASPHARDGFFGWELTNEVVPNTITPSAWGRDAAALKELARVIFTAQGLPPPPLVGPDQSCCDAQEEVMAATPPGVISALTYHEYPQCVSPGEASGLVMSPVCLSAIDRHAAGAVAAAASGRGGAPPPPAWMGEGADHSGGGVAGLTDTFRSSYYTAWLYGATAAAGVELTARQCLSGGDYELLQRDGGGFAPNPDFWVVYLFKALIGAGGARAYNVTHSSPPTATGVRVFAFSPAAAGSQRQQAPTATLALLALNLQTDTPVAVTLAGQGAGGARVEFHLSGNASAVHGDVACNGAVLRMDPSTHAPPPVQGLGVSAPAGSPLTLQPGGIAFVLIE